METGNEKIKMTEKNEKVMKITDKKMKISYICGYKRLNSSPTKMLSSSSIISTCSDNSGIKKLK